MARVSGFRVSEKKVNTADRPVPREKTTAHSPDYQLLAIALALIAFGLVMVYSASSPSAYIYQEGNSAYYFKRQLMWAVVGAVAMALITLWDYRKLGKYIKTLALLCYA